MTVLYSNNLFSWVKVAGPAIAICLLTDKEMQNSNNVYFEGMFWILAICYLLNLFSIIIYYPEGMYRLEKVVGDLYLMGYDNSMIYNLLPLCGVSFILSYKKYGKLITKYSIFALAITFISEFWVMSASGVLQILFFVMLLYMLRKESKIITPVFIFWLFFIISIAINIFSIQNAFSWLIVDILNKDLTLTRRTFLWEYAMQVIAKNPVIGIGFGEKNIMGIYEREYSHPHSMLLDILVKGGVVLMTIFILILNNFTKKFKKSKNLIIKNIIFLVIAVFLIGEVVNSVQYKVFFWSFLVLIEYTEKIKYEKRIEQK